MYEEFSRLEVLYPEDSTANADVEYVINLQKRHSPPLMVPLLTPGESIVLVAGLGGHYKTTWEASDRTMWPVHLLPRDIAGIRVLSFHYNTTLRGTTSSVKIRDHALELLDRLDLDRIGGRDELASLRPIIFVGHSLGGMLIKQVIGAGRPP
jgi:pimeloyl-ACP methyl ester carboxylesterase